MSSAEYHNTAQPQFAFFKICQCLFFIYLEIWARPRIGMLFHLFPNLKKSCYSHAQSVCICCQMVTAQTVSAADERHNYAFRFLVFRSAADVAEVFLCGASHYPANTLLLCATAFFFKSWNLRLCLPFQKRVCSHRQGQLFWEMFVQKHVFAARSRLCVALIFLLTCMCWWRQPK